MKKYILILIKTLFALFIITLLSCPEEIDYPEFSVQNQVSGVALLDPSWGDYTIYETLIPGERSDSLEIDIKDDFGKKRRIEFYLSAKNKYVYLQTMTKYKLNEGDNKKVIINDNTEVYNPLQIRNQNEKENIIKIKDFLNSLDNITLY